MNLTVFVLKANGSTQPFDRAKVLNTCLRLGASRREAEIVTRKVERRVYNGMETRRILKMIFRYLGKIRPSVSHQICLRKALSLMKPKPDFERFVRLLLRADGHDVIPNQVLRGRCVEHEVDAVATKDGVTRIVEVKHHYNYHTPTGLDVSRIARAVFEDVTEGYKIGLNAKRIDGAMIVSNTKLSNHARRYAECKQIQHIGWSSPQNHGLQSMIEEKRLYPITYLKGLNAGQREKLASAGIILLKQLVAESPKELEKKGKIPKKILESIVNKAETVLVEQ